MIAIWLGGSVTRYYSVSPEAIANCYALPKRADRFAYWQKITGDPTIAGNAMVWWPL